MTDIINEGAVISAFLQHKTLSLQDFEDKNLISDIDQPANGNRRTILHDIIQGLAKEGRLRLVQSHPVRRWRYDLPGQDPFDTEAERKVFAIQIIDNLLEGKIFEEYELQDFVFSAIVNRIPQNKLDPDKVNRAKDLAEQILLRDGAIVAAANSNEVRIADPDFINHRSYVSYDQAKRQKKSIPIMQVNNFHNQGDAALEMDKSTNQEIDKNTGQVVLQAGNQSSDSGRVNAEIKSPIPSKKNKIDWPLILKITAGVIAITLAILKGFGLI